MVLDVVTGRDTRLRKGLLAAGLLGAAAALVAAPRDAVAAAARTWPPFVLVAGLLLLGVVANKDGVFGSAGALLDRLPGGDLTLYLAAMAFVAVVTVFLNLDTSVAFLTPALIYVARERNLDEARLLYGCVFMSNAASLLLPGSNLTNLLILADGGVRGAAFLSRMLAPWCAAVAVTAAGVAIVFRGRQPRRAVRPVRMPMPTPHPLSLVGIAGAVALILLLPDAALPVLGIGAGLAALRLAQGRLGRAELFQSLDLASIAGLFLVAVSLGTLARAWSYPGHLMGHAGSAASAGIGAVASVLVNNLPAAVLLGSRMPAHPISLLFGLDIGPNLAVTGSLSALVWWQAARALGARPSARRYALAGAVLVPLTIGAALAAQRLVPLAP